jgi:hypothetical protein
LTIENNHNFFANNILIHNSNWRASLLPSNSKKLWHRILQFFKLKSKYEFCYGSNNVQLQSKKKDHKGYYDENYYLEMVKKYDIDKKLRPGETVYAEMIGDKIQKNYTYGCKDGERKLVVFDVLFQDLKTKEMRWYTLDELCAFCIRTGLEMVPILFWGSWKKDLAATLVQGPSEYCPDQKVREGIVIKHDSKEKMKFEERAKIKWINAEYLRKEEDGETTENS